jgi:hypothetical protein
MIDTLEGLFCRILAGAADAASQITAAALQLQSGAVIG